MSDAITYCKECTTNVLCHLERRCVKHYLWRGKLIKTPDEIMTLSVQRKSVVMYGRILPAAFVIGMPLNYVMCCISLKQLRTYEKKKKK